MVALARPLTAAALSADLDFEALYTQHVRYVAGVVHRLMGNDSEVDDLVQETFLEAIGGLAALSDPADIRAWLVTVAVRRTRAFLARRRRRRMFAFRAFDVVARASDPRDRQAVDDLYDALGRLPEDLRIPWILHRIVAMNLPEAAAACEISLATVKRRLADAEQRLERRLAPPPRRTP
ncbi:MAG TPA: sigma-70 family RNA polymerase sigma factor [Polyangiaceae bacterium]|nr:sigma-70 family RNA polymerase sigma factor [Polyangiaceae bacterium]